MTGMSKRVSTFFYGSGIGAGQAGTLRGFTILELLVVLAIVSLVMAIALPRLSGTVTTSELRSAARSLAAGMRWARSEAIYTNRPINFQVDVNGRRFGMTQKGSMRSLPENARVTLFTARSQLLDEDKGYIRFFPDGSSSGGRVTLATKRLTQYVDVDWLTGRISIQDEPAT